MNILNCIQFSFEILCLLMKEWNAIPIHLHGRWPVQKVLPTVSPALEDDAGEASQSGSAAPQLSGSHFSSAGTLLRGLPPLWKSCVGAAVQWVGLKMWKEHRRGKTELVGGGEVRRSIKTFFSQIFDFYMESKTCYHIGSHLFHRCPNPLDPAPPQAVPSHPQPLSPDAQTRRFTITTFQFLPDGEFKDLDEEVSRNTATWVLHIMVLGYSIGM